MYTVRFVCRLARCSETWSSMRAGALRITLLHACCECCQTFRLTDFIYIYICLYVSWHPICHKPSFCSAYFSSCGRTARSCCCGRTSCSCSSSSGSCLNHLSCSSTMLVVTWLGGMSVSLLCHRRNSFALPSVA